MYSNVFHAISFARKANFTCACGWATSRLLSDARMVHTIRIIPEDASQHWMRWCRLVASSRRLCVWAALNFTAICSLRFALISTQSIIFTCASYGRRGKLFGVVYIHTRRSVSVVRPGNGVRNFWNGFDVTEKWANTQWFRHLPFSVNGWKLDSNIDRHVCIRTTSVLPPLFASLNDRDQHRTVRSNPRPSSAIICTDHSIHRRTYYFRSKWIMARIIPSYSACIPMSCVRNASINIIVAAVACWHTCAKKLRMCVPD